MHAITLLTVFVTSALAQRNFAVRTDSMTVKDASNKCGNGQVISCCNTVNQNGASGGLLNNALGNVLGGSCSPIPINVGVQVPIQQACGNNQAACCSGDQTGLVNVQCTPIGL